MKIIQSEGGPLIGIARADLDNWSGVFGSTSSEKNSPIDNDYEALCEFTNSSPAPVIGVVKNGICQFIFISDPLPTLIVDAGPSHLFLAQIDTSEEGWSEAELRASDFERSIGWREAVSFRFRGGEILFFDSAGNLRDVPLDYLSIFLQKGTYLCEWARQKWEGKANLIFVRMMRKDD